MLKYEEGKMGDWVVIHLSVNYDPEIIMVQSGEFEAYFTIDNGWDVEDIGKVYEMQVGEVEKLDQGSIVIIKV